jgi:hypothetical protein
MLRRGTQSQRFARWELLCRAPDAAAAGYLLRYEPRRVLTLQDLSSSCLEAAARVARGEFDFVGLLLWAAPLQEAGECFGVAWPRLLCFTNAHQVSSTEAFGVR